MAATHPLPQGGTDFMTHRHLMANTLTEHYQEFELGIRVLVNHFAPLGAMSVVAP
jgi:hypothetical protein